MFHFASVDGVPSSLSYPDGSSHWLLQISSIIYFRLPTCCHELFSEKQFLINAFEGQIVRFFLGGGKDLTKV